MHRFKAIAVLTVFVAACNGSDFAGHDSKNSDPKKPGLATTGVQPEDSTHQNVPASQSKAISSFLPTATVVACTSADSTIATCDATTGKIEGHSPGQTDVTIQTADGPVVVHVTVTPPTTTGPTPADDSIPADSSQDDVTASIDAACEFPDNGNKPDQQLPITPKGPALPSTAPADCQAAVEFNNLKQAAFQLTASNDQGSRSLKLEVDVATYTAADRMSLRAVLADGTERLIFDTCRLRTWSEADPTNGNTRPPEATIRDFRPVLPKGTKMLKFDFTGATTPTYMRVRGLCDFVRTPQFYTGSGSGNFAVRPLN